METASWVLSTPGMGMAGIFYVPCMGLYLLQRALNYRPYVEAGS